MDKYSLGIMISAAAAGVAAGAASNSINVGACTFAAVMTGLTVLCGAIRGK